MVRSLPALLLLASCAGPPASDAALCQDLIHRVCLSPRCPAVDSLEAGPDCEKTLLDRTGCSRDGFVLESISRPRFLECRLPLLRAGVHTQTHPDCDDLASSLEDCPELVQFLGGGAQ